MLTFWTYQMEATQYIPRIDERHRRELLRFLLTKTAPVRCGLKPGELLRVKNCYASRNAEGLRYCLYRDDVYRTLGLDFAELLDGGDSTLVLFYNPARLARTLAEPANARILAACGYAPDATPAGALSTLARRFAANGICHEVGVFVGYPAKDVVGFMNHLPCTPGHDAPWRIFGDAAESISLAKLYRSAEDFAARALDSARSLADFFATCERWRPAC